MVVGGRANRNGRQEALRRAWATCGAAAVVPCWAMVAPARVPIDWTPGCKRRTVGHGRQIDLTCNTFGPGAAVAGGGGAAGDLACDDQGGGAVGHAVQPAEAAEFDGGIGAVGLGRGTMFVETIINRVDEIALPGTGVALAKVGVALDAGLDRFGQRLACGIFEGYGPGARRQAGMGGGALGSQGARMIVTRHRVLRYWSISS